MAYTQAMSCDRSTVLSALAELAPLELAEPWDNVGLLIDPGLHAWRRAFLTIDLTDLTLQEAVESDADLLIVYHPPLFSGLKKLRVQAPGEKLVVRALQRGLTVYSPHTALDAAQGGMTDWLIQALGSGTARPVVPQVGREQEGSGRWMELDEPLDLEEAVERLKQHLGLTQLRLSRGLGSSKVRTWAACPGAGGAVFEKCEQVDLLVTGEMRHHDVLGRALRGTHVVLTDHTNTERGYLPHLARRLTELCPGLDAQLSLLDRDPLEVV